MTIKQLQELKAKGLIKDFEQPNRPVVKLPAIKNKTKAWIDLNLRYWCKANKHLLLTEQKFDEKRKWRFDWMVCGMVVAIEYEGIVSDKSRHTTMKGYTGDADKYSAAQIRGIKVLRYTALNYKNMITDLEKLKQTL
jgi:hypothetical protein